MTAPKKAAGFPSSIESNPLLRQWVDLSERGTARVLSGKVELGQGILTAFTQIAAEELRLPVDQVSIVSGDTRYCPDEVYTAGSFSVEMGGRAIKTACARVRRALIAAAARRLDCAESAVTVENGKILQDGKETGLDYWEISQDLDLDQEMPGPDDWAQLADSSVIGRNVARVDLPAKITGGAFIHDIELPEMLHARIVHPPAPGAVLESVDDSRVRKMPGVVDVVQSGSFLAVCCEKEYQAIRGREALARDARWSDGEPLPHIGEWGDWLVAQTPAGEEETEIGQRLPDSEGIKQVEAAYSRPLLAHASIGPACSLARVEDGVLTVWTHSQGVFPLRRALAQALEMDLEDVAVVHAQGAGSYGHNAADDAAFDAAFLAVKMAPRPVRVQWMRDDDLTWSPFGAPMSQKLSGAVTKEGAVADWCLDIWSGPQTSRPGFMGSVGLLGAARKEPPIPLTTSRELPALFMAGDRNAQALYELPRQRIVYHKVHVPFRTSSLRTLGAFGNVFAIECFMDELAEAAGLDPIEFRLKHLSDGRARRVVEAVAAMAGWRPNAPVGDGSAMGMAFSRYKNTAAYVAAIAEVAVGDDIRVDKVWCAVDAGLVINPDGVKNQIEGGAIQSVSWTLKESVPFDHSSVTSKTWEDYPILRFDEAPDVAVQVLEAPADSPPLGVGEASPGPVAAAVANGIARALGLRIRDLPITRERILAATG